ncbi:MAG: hypothetical protein HFH38_15345 [Lachnospiraceae bacterium]|jgi:hypothetical protein|nr:hypothetical protein [Lachnospiraceae bacterium]
MKNNKKMIWILAGVLGMAMLVLLVLAVKGRNAGSKDAYALNYTVKADSASSSIVNVAVEIIPGATRTEKGFLLQMPEIAASEPKCVTKSGKEATVEETGNAWMIGLPGEVEPFTFTYDVRMGEQADTDGGTVYGAFYEDLLVFQGNQVLALPLVGQEEASEIEQSVSELNFKLDTKYEWNSIMPFVKENGKEFSFTQEKPDWDVFNKIYHSAFCFGDFEKIPMEEEKDALYIEQPILDTADINDLEAVKLFYGYYKQLFKGSSRAPVVLLRADGNNDVILGGAGASGAALTLEMEEAKDCERMSRTLYHAFFDSMNRQRSLRYAPNLWLYNGLADFYSEDSALSLSNALRAEYGISMQDNLLTRYGKYLYYMLSDQSIAVASPETEGQMTVTQEDFYYDFKVPVIIAAIETFGKEDSDEQSVLVSYFIDHGEEKEFDLKDFNKQVLGTNEEAARQYLSGESFVPNYWNLNDSALGDYGILPAIYEREAWYEQEYEQQNMVYPCPSFELIDREKLDEEIAGRDLTFGSEELERLVKGYSENLYYWCMQAMLRAEVCDVKEPTTPDGKAALYGNEEEKVWEEYCEKNY